MLTTDEPCVLGDALAAEGSAATPATAMTAVVMMRSFRIMALGSANHELRTSADSATCSTDQAAQLYRGGRRSRDSATRAGRPCRRSVNRGWQGRPVSPVASCTESTQLGDIVAVPARISDQ